MNDPERKPKVGTLLLSSGWFHDVGMKGDSLVNAIETSRQEIVASFSGELDLIFPESIHSVATAREAADAFNRVGIDLLLVCYLTWAEDQPFLELLEHIHPGPMLLWCYHPTDRLPDRVPVEQMLRSSGGVGVLQSSGMLRRRGLPASLVIGSHTRESVRQRILQAAACAALRTDLRRLKIGVLPSRCDQMSTTWVDEFALRSQIGPSLTFLSVNQYQDAAEVIDAPTVARLCAEIRENWTVSDEVDDEALERSLRASLALDRLAAQHDLGAIALQDVSDELHERMGGRPGLMLTGLFSRPDLVVSMEADVGAAVLMFLLRRLSNRPCLYTEPLTYDLERNHLVMGHAGLSDASLAAPGQLQIIPDFEYKNSNPTCGAVSHFVMAPGPVTLANCVYSGNHFQFTSLRGESVSNTWALDEGYAHAVVQPEIMVDAFFQRSFNIGVSQHWIVVPGDMVSAINQLAGFLDVAHHDLASD